jgi:hypothetical protein
MSTLSGNTPKPPLPAGAQPESTNMPEETDNATPPAEEAPTQEIIPAPEATPTEAPPAEEAAPAAE